MEDHPHPHHIRDDVKHIHPPQTFFAAPFTKNDQGLGVGVCVQRLQQPGKGHTDFVRLPMRFPKKSTIW